MAETLNKIKSSVDESVSSLSMMIAKNKDVLPERKVKMIDDVVTKCSSVSPQCCSHCQVSVFTQLCTSLNSRKIS